jgi:hypothetical protein
MFKFNVRANSENQKNQLSTLEILPAAPAKLFFLPLCYALFGFLYYYQSGSFFSTLPDSTYIYLINGTNIASGNFVIGHYDNPGTPAHWMTGIVIYITHLFIGKGPLSQDVLANPELYLKVCAYVAIFLLMFTVYQTGKLIYKNTNSLFTALFFQLIPISSYEVINNFDRFIPEYIMVLAIPYYCALLWVLCVKKENGSGSELPDTRNLLIFAFLTALLFTAKITCLPFIIIPFFFIKRTFPKILFFVFTFIFGALILFPVWPNLGNMFKWFKGLATHSGVYGHGKEELFNMSEFMTGVGKIFSTELFFTYGYALISLAVIVGLLKKKRKENFYKLTFALWLIISTQTFLAAKHYSYHYILPSQLLIITAVLAAGQVLVPFMKTNKTFRYAAFTICGSFLLYHASESATVYKDGNPIYETSLTVRKYDNLPKIYTTGYIASSFVQSGLNFGSCYGGNYYQDQYYFLRKLYPTSYFYSLDGKYLKWFETDIASSEIFEKYPQVIVYFLETEDGLIQSSLKTITAGYDSVIKVSLLQDNRRSREKFYLLSVDTSKTKPRYASVETITCDFENKTADGSLFTSSNENIKFDAANLATNEAHFSGNTCIKTDPENRYAACTAFPVKPGDDLDVTVNYHAIDQPGGLNLVTSNGAMFDKISNTIVHDYGDGWKKLRLKARIPENYPEKMVKFCLFYYGKQTCYFDDLNIVFSKK